MHDDDPALTARMADTWGAHDGAVIPAPELCDACDAFAAIAAPTVDRPRIWRRTTIHETGCPSLHARRALALADAEQLALPFPHEAQR